MKSNRLDAAALSKYQGDAQRSVAWPLAASLSVVLAATGLAAAFTFLYAVSRPSITAQSWDSLHFGYAAEAEGWRGLASNHPLGHAIYRVALTLARSAGYTGRALPLFQGLNTLVGGLNVAGVWLLCYARLRTSVWTALGVAVIFGSCAAVWYYAGTAEIYTMALLLAIASWGSLLHNARSDVGDSLWFAGVLVGFAVLTHQLNLLLVPVALVLLLAPPQPRHLVRKLVTFSSAVGIVTIIGYGILGHLATGSTSLRVLATWPRGYLGEPLYGGYLRLRNLPMIWWNARAAIVHSEATSGMNRLRGMLVVAVCGVTVYGLLSYRRLGPCHRAVLGAAVLDGLSAFLLVCWWEPFTQKYWLFVLLPWIIALACLRSARIDTLGSWWAQRIPAGTYDCFAPLLGCCLLLFNLRCMLRYEDRPDPVRERAVAQWLEHSRPTDVLIPPTELVPFLRYWEDRPNTLLVFTCLWYSSAGDTFGTLSQTIAAAFARGAAVLYAPASIDDVRDDQLPILRLSRDALGRFFAHYSQRLAFSVVPAADRQPAPTFFLSPPDDNGSNVDTRTRRSDRQGPC
ncbi:MAG: hypothetical protein ACHQ4J_10585 [Candidatus Binatia bacterium]